MAVVPNGPEEVLGLLTHKTRVLVPEQVASFVSRQTLDRWVTAGILARVPALVRWPLPELREPLAVRLPGERAEWQTPAGSIAEAAERRWQAVGTKVVPLYLATQAAAKLTGGVATGELRQVLQAGHDLALTSLYLAQRPEVCAGWIGEDMLRTTLGWDRYDKVPDAVVTGLPDIGPVAVELIGSSYGAARVAAFQRFCVERDLAYEIW